MAREELLQKFSAKFGPEKGKTMEEALAFAAAVHEGQTRESGEPYIIHPIAVAEYLMDMGMDWATVVAGVLPWETLDILSDHFMGGKNRRRKV